MLGELTHATFADCLGSKFRLHHGGPAPLDVDLVAVTPLGDKDRPRPAKREPFSLLFRGPRDFYLPQRIYQLEHPTLGALEIFLVPVGPDDAGMRFEAVFN
jgi:hypothetical protein